MSVHILYNHTTVPRPNAHMGPNYYGDGNHYMPMDRSTIWVVFILTLLIHALTFCFLEYCADRFKDFMLMSPTDGRGTTEAVKQTTVEQQLPKVGTFCSITGYSQSHAPSPSYRMALNDNIKYQQFHDTLDVSVFR